MRINFSVPGDPVPYLRMTQGQVKLMRIPDHKLRPAGLKVKQRIRRYLNYKAAVGSLACGHDIDTSPRGKVYLNVMIHFGSHKHGDPENIRKGIQDAIYDQDKMVAGNVDFDYDRENPRMEIEIIQ